MGKSAGAALPGRGPGLAVWAAVALAAGLGAAQAGAETAAQLDAASQATDKAPAGIALARRQIASDELLDAMATLERVMMNNPANLEARALHAGLLCRIDDRRGAVLEFDLIRGLPVPPATLAEARHACQGGR